ncbi:glycosyltransferase [Leptolyngbya sp. FACHB-261]|nr:glycosyltransferase [Leptolyngbya sp. FACHB-261]
MTITVLVPTYRRPQDLARCLSMLQQQNRPADEVLVIARDTDAETWAFLQDYDPQSLNLRTVKVTVPGQVAALNAGLDAAQGEIIAITDDDAAPRTDWLSRIEAHFLADSQVGGVGGRDWIRHEDRIESGTRETVGQVQWFGRVIGNHHLGTGSAREVDILKGANMSYRRTAIAGLRFDERLRGTGAQVNNDLAFSLAVKRAGYKLIYDPAVAVDHYEGSRWGDDRVGHFDSALPAVYDSSFNEALVLLDYLPASRRALYLSWSLLIGTRKSPGILQAMRFTVPFGALAWLRCFTVQRGKFSALLALRSFQ